MTTSQKKERKKKRRQRRKERRQQRRLLRAEESGEATFRAVDPESEVILLAADGQAEEGALRKFKMVAYKGGRLFVDRFYHPVVVDLTGMKAKRKSYPSLRQHDPNRVIGHTTQHAIEANRITAEGLVSGTGETADEVASSAENGFPWQASIGIRMEMGSVDFIDEENTVEVNGRKFKGPIHVVRASVLNELSWVPVGGDEDEATARIAASGDRPEIGDIQMKFAAWLKAKGFDINTLTAEQKEFFRGQFDKYKEWLEANHFDVNTITAEQNSSMTAMFEASQREQGEPTGPPSGTPGDSGGGGGNPSNLNAGGSGRDDELEAAMERRRRAEADEINRINRIRQICAEHGNPSMQINNREVSLEAHAIGENMTITEVELECLRQSRGSASVQASSHAGSCTIEAMQGAVMLAGGVPLDWDGFGTMQAQAMGLPAWTARGINDDARQRIMEAAQRFSEMSSLDICREAVRLDGRMVPGGRSEIIQAAFSGSNLLNIWTTNINARLLMKFRETGDSTMGWTQERDVADFRLNERTRVEKGGQLTKHARGKTADSHDGSDTAESYRIARYSKKFFRDEMDVIDDRLMAGQDVIDEMALAAARLRPDLVYAILLGNPNMDDGTPLFDASRNNLDAAAALAEATLKARITAMRLQQENKVNLNLQPSWLVTAGTLEFDADQIIRSAETRAAAATGGLTKNPLNGRIPNVISDSRIDNGVTDPDSGTVIAGDDTMWFVISTDGPTIEVGFLRGTGRAPSVTTWRKNGEDGQWGVGASVKMDIGAKALAAETMQRASN